MSMSLASNPTRPKPVSRSEAAQAALAGLSEAQRSAVREKARAMFGLPADKFGDDSWILLSACRVLIAEDGWEEGL